jgi:hypothetical protein
VVGYWLNNGTTVERATIVVLGSEGGFQVLAPDLYTLLTRIAWGQFAGKGPAADFAMVDEPDLRRELQSFLETQSSVSVYPPAPTPDFAAWVARTTAEHEAAMRSNPAILAMAPILEKYRPTTGQPWEATSIHINWAGNAFEASVTQGQWRALDEAQLIKPHVAALRDAAAADVKGLGLWHQANLKIYKDGPFLVPDYLYAPKFERVQPTPTDYKDDQSRAPRATRRIPGWLATILA